MRHLLAVLVCAMLAPPSAAALNAYDGLGPPSRTEGSIHETHDRFAADAQLIRGVVRDESASGAGV